jgi:hypothetical protein
MYAGAIMQFVQGGDIERQVEPPARNFKPEKNAVHAANGLDKATFWKTRFYSIDSLNNRQNSSSSCPRVSW